MAVITTYSWDLVKSIYPAGLKSGADAVGLANGGIAVVGNQPNQPGLSIFGEGGSSAGATNALTGINPALAELANGNLVIAADGGAEAVYRVVDSSGKPVTESLGASIGGWEPVNVDVAGLADGGFAIASESVNGEGETSILVTMHGSDGSYVSLLPVAGDNQEWRAPSIAALDGGGFVVAWHRVDGYQTEIWYAVYEDDGTTRKAPALFDTTGTTNRNVTVEALPDGGFAMAYEDSGWADGSDTEITLARLNYDGTLIGLDNLTQNNSPDLKPSMTVLSNGMIAVGVTASGFGDSDAGWILADGQTGDRLAYTVTGVNDDYDQDYSTLAGMGQGRIGAFYTNKDSGHVEGLVFQATRDTIGDGDDNLIDGDDLRDVVHAGDGADTVQGGGGRDSLYGEGGDDTFMIGAGEKPAGETIDGGSDNDRIVALASTNLTSGSIASIEAIEFRSKSAAGATIIIGAAQIGAGLASNLLIDGYLGGVADRLRFVMRDDEALDLSALQFVDFAPGNSAENDRLEVFGDEAAETIVGSAMRDDISGAGGDDKLDGGSGVDKLRGGAGDDIFTIDGYHEAFEKAGQGSDTVRAAFDYALEANLEKLVLTGAGKINGAGNALANILVGNSGANMLNGGGGKDVMTGGGGSDRFFFNSALDGVTNVDKVLDFETGVDKIRLDEAIFAGLTNSGRAAAFRVGTVATDASDRIIYNEATGALYFDPDGVGGAAQIKFAMLDAGLDLKATDFYII